MAARRQVRPGRRRWPGTRRPSRALRGLGQVRGLERGGNPGGRARQGLASGVLGDDLGGLGAGGDPLPSRLQGLRQTPVQPGLPGGAEGVVDRLPARACTNSYRSAAPAAGSIRRPAAHRGRPVRPGRRDLPPRLDREEKRPGESRCGYGHPFGLIGKAGETAGDNLPHAFGTATSGRLASSAPEPSCPQRPFLQHVTDHFLGEERVPAGVPRDGHCQGRRHRQPPPRPPTAARSPRCPQRAGAGSRCTRSRPASAQKFPRTFMRRYLSGRYAPASRQAVPAAAGHVRSIIAVPASAHCRSSRTSSTGARGQTPP